MKAPDKILCHVCGEAATYRGSTASSWLYKCAHGHTNEIPKPTEPTEAEERGDGA